MAQFGLDNIRNVVLLAHAGTGKTSLSEIMLFTAGAISRLGKVEAGSTTSDYDQDEIKRRMSINLKLLPHVWKDIKINLIDTPGYADFVSEVKAGIRVSEGAVILVCAASGVEVGTEQVWGYSEEARLPRLIFVNRTDRDNADFNRTVEQIRAKFGNRCVPMQAPIGAQADFKGVVDLLTMKAYTGVPPKEEEIPAAMKAQVSSFREKLVEAIAEVDDKLIEKYLGGEELTQDELTGGLKQAVKSGKIAPILVGSATQNIGINSLLDAICSYLPAPKEREFEAIDISGKTVTVAPKEDEPLAALVFKTTADPYVGRLTYFRVYQGVINSNSQVFNCTRGETERVGQLLMIRGKNQEPVPQFRAGDIGAVAKLNVTATNDTLCSQENKVKLPPIQFPIPIFSEAVHPKSKADVDKMGTALSRIVEEDPTLQIRREPSTGETVMYGMGDAQLDVAADRMQRKFGVNVELTTPKVPYRETVTASVRAEFRHKKQTGGHGQFGHVVIEVEPKPRDSGNEFEDKVVGGAVPRNYIPAAEKGVHEALQEGVLSGYPVVDVKIRLVDGSFHPVDSSDMAFKIAGAGAVKKGMADAQPILLEPIVNIKVTVPEAFTGDIISDLNTKRGRVLGMTPEDGANVIEAQVPLAEVQRYTIDLKSLTQGRGTYTMSFSHYEPVPPQVAQKVIAERQAEKEAAKAA